MQIITLIIIASILLVTSGIQIHKEQQNTYKSANEIFSKIEQILEGNQKELKKIKTEYNQKCLYKAEAIAYIIQKHPAMLKNTEELKKIAQLIEVDEIHIFDSTGRIFAGTNPEYYNYTFDSGKQIRFFKPMLKDKSLKITQDITPNTAEGKLMQYSALWSENKEFIVQVGITPTNLMKAMEKNELSYIFSLFRVNVGAELYAVDTKSGKIVGSTNLKDVGKNLRTTGLLLKDIQNSRKGFHADINGVNCYCIFKQIDNNYIGYIIASKALYQHIPAELTGLALCLILIAIILVLAVTWYMNKYVIKDIQNINEKLFRITSGKLEENINVQSSLEFSELSSHINEIIKNLLSERRQIEEERDIDLLTGLYNRRGIENKVSALFKGADKQGYYALIMIDADGLKEINDKYGHEKGDLYLKKISELLHGFSEKNSIAARYGGDEFVLFLYNYANKKELNKAIKALEYLQHHSTVHLGSKIQVPLKFSFGVSSIAHKQSNYHILLKQADEKMYQNKRKRK
ncbi:MAG: GGDEF domain-containing protein, partial [bacterium]